MIEFSAIRYGIKTMIDISETELDALLSGASVRIYKPQEFLNKPNKIANDVYFINKGILRVLITDHDGEDHTIHFALEHQFIADYTSFLCKTPSISALQAIEETEVVVLPRAAIDWGYANLKEGQKLGRLIAEYYFTYQDNRIINQYARTPKQRYDAITDVFPNIHNRVPQYMIASYLGISPIHLSRLKKEEFKKYKS
jgi:CRP-like cAMP-binding protein